MNAPASSVPAVSVVIATWNTREMVCDALAAVEAETPEGGLEILVIDNGSEDGTVEAVRHRFPGVHLIRNERNLGYAPANNQGIRASRGNYVLLLGSDTLVRRGAVRAMAGFLDSRPEAAAVACRLVNPDGSPQMSCRRFPRLRDAVATYLSLHVLARHYTMHGFDFHRTQEVEQPAATALMVRAGVLRRLDGFDEAYTILYNDVDLCRRMRDLGGRIFFTADAEIMHYGSSTTSTAPPDVRAVMYRNIILYFRRHHGPLAVLVLTPLLALRLLAVTRSLRALRRFLVPDTGGGR